MCSQKRWFAGLTISAAILHAIAVARLAVAGFPQPRIPFGRIALQGFLERRFDLLPAFHYLPPAGTRRCNSSKKFSRTVTLSWDLCSCSGVATASRTTAKRLPSDDSA